MNGEDSSLRFLPTSGIPASRGRGAFGARSWLQWAVIGAVCANSSFRPTLIGTFCTKRTYRGDRCGRELQLVERTLDQRDVHPAVELVGGVLDRPHDREAVFGVEREAGAVVGGDARHDRQVAEDARLL